jgi:DnaJ-class molecular chaperone
MRERGHLIWCPACGGAGELTPAYEAEGGWDDLCDVCSGDGVVEKGTEVDCGRCGGSGGGPDRALKCPSCLGTGRVELW